ncbi:MAG: pilus assembly protein CpaE [Acidobacteriaceae bacterium]|jgi:pilus assembly protein CpaE
MHGVAVSLLTYEKERLAVLQHRLENSNMANLVFSSLSFPGGATDPILRRIQDVGSEIVILDIDPRSVQFAIQAIELINANSNGISVFAVGELRDPSLIVSAMRAGAREYFDKDISTERLLEAFSRHTSSRGKTQNRAGRARIFTVINAKGGAGSTTVAVNTAVALQESQGSTLLVDFAPLGHCALHLDARPTFGVADALQNLHRLDSSLLDGLLINCKGGLRLLAGAQQANPQPVSAAELTQMFDVLATHFRHIVVDCSGRIDQTARLLCDLSHVTLLVTQADVVSLWSAGRVRTFLEEGSSREHVRLVLNRFMKIPGFTDQDIEKATNSTLLCKLPNSYQSVAPAIDKGMPVVFQENQEISRRFRSLAVSLAAASAAPDDSQDVSPEGNKADPKKKPVGRLLISPLRAGH